MRRVASLLPSTTEIVHALGCADTLVLRSHECDFPPGVDQLPFATAPRTHLTGSSVAIDQTLLALLEAGLGLFQVDAAALRAGAPDLILTQDQCQVCAVPFSAIEAAARELLTPHPEILSLSPTTVDEVLGTVVQIAHALGVPARGDALRNRLATGFEAVRAAAATLPEPRPRVLTIEWFDPLMPAGNWVPELVELAGGENLLGAPGTHSPLCTWDAMRATDPDLIVLLPCGFDLAKTLDEVGTLRALPGWGDLRAVREGRVAAVDGNAYMNRPGPRLLDSAEILLEIIAGARGSGLPPSVPRREGEGWGWVTP
jgi:iron complex transport system substrate-binding protein